MLQLQNKTVHFRRLGLIDYKEAWDYQTSLFEYIIGIKVANRNISSAEAEPTPNYVLSCQHPHVYTLGKSGKKDHLLLSPELLNRNQASFYEINRGGDITYHGPGQIVLYPILDLDNFFTDIHKYMRYLEEAVIRTIKEYGVQGDRLKGMTGVWIDCDHSFKARKICAMGVKTSRWVTMHGLALNVNTDLNYFNHIVPCGIPDKAVTSLERETEIDIDVNQVEMTLLKHLADLFEMELKEFNEERY